MSGYETQLSRYTPFFTTLSLLLPFYHTLSWFFLSLLVLNGMTALTQWLVLHTRTAHISCQATFHHRKSSIIYLKAQVLVLHWDNCGYMLYASVLCLCKLCLVLCTHLHTTCMQQLWVHRHTRAWMQEKQECGATVMLLLAVTGAFVTEFPSVLMDHRKKIL